MHRWIFAPLDFILRRLVWRKGRERASTADRQKGPAAMADKDLYGLLGLQRNASAAQIKKASQIGTVRICRG